MTAVPGAAQQIELPWVTIPSGTFRMGCVPGDSACLDSERPRHEVTLSTFDLMATEVTVGQYSAFVAATGYQRPAVPDYPQAPDHPAVHVTWHDAAAFCEWAGGRLPTEAEWEYAARAGHDGRLYWWGDELTRDYANFGTLQCCSGATGGADTWLNTAPVGSFPPNDFGLHDMIGNVWEWVDGWITPSYPAGPLTDPQPAETGYLRVMRGASWLNFPERAATLGPPAVLGRRAHEQRRRTLCPGRADPDRLRRVTRWKRPCRGLRRFGVERRWGAEDADRRVRGADRRRRSALRNGRAARPFPPARWMESRALTPLRAHD